MKKDRDYWTPTFEEFCRLYPHLAERVVDWYPSGQLEITVKLDDGRRYSYDWLSKSIYTICKANGVFEEHTETEWRLIFSRNLRRKLKKFPMTQDMLSELTGITRITISNYMTGKVTPSSYNLARIASALKCSVSELLSTDI